MRHSLGQARFANALAGARYETAEPGDEHS
ncbi:hypothetical protein FB470_004387 [Amycolatopsis thermophila]|uniref:Uncharacterized protein n=1 Tax=Amycolatopsis thermophila TaxID=206084 RepID=A0ABU0EZ19_9PSEU|nr:hypothetical protein [Amycolatopsis thermophila]